ncbi:MAG TPA: hypothetical protein VND64_06265 [Pirellulales bacterium]|nr:hypothetical protein [Pirellulales bacterium]
MRRSQDWPVPHVPMRQAIWLDGPVPPGYWQDPRNRRRYVCWLGQRLRFRKLEDWHKISTADFKRNHGAGLLQSHYRDSAIAAVMECFPDHEWHEWEFRTAPIHFWQDQRNHRRYMSWLGKQLGFRRPEDWYGITTADFQKHKGGAFLLHYDSSAVAAVMAYLPDYGWKEWLFTFTPKDFWSARRNRRRYMDWLAEQLGIRDPEDWYAVTQREFNANAGNQFLKLYNGLPFQAIKAYIPSYPWKEWLFSRVPFHFWHDQENRRRYMRWLGRKLGFRKPADWQAVRLRHFQENCGAGLIARYDSYVDVLEEYLPGIGWATSRRR